MMDDLCLCRERLRGPITINPVSIQQPALLLPVRLEVRRLGNELCISSIPRSAVRPCDQEQRRRKNTIAGFPLMRC